MATMESSSSQGGVKIYLCRHTCGCKLRHSSEFTRSTVSSQGALWYHEHNDTLHPKHTPECEYEQYKNSRKGKDGKSKEKDKDKARHNSVLNGSNSASSSMQEIVTSAAAAAAASAGNVNSSNFMPIQPQQNYNIYPKLIFQSYPNAAAAAAVKNSMANGSNSALAAAAANTLRSAAAAAAANGNTSNGAGGASSKELGSSGSNSPTLQSMSATLLNEKILVGGGSNGGGGGKASSGTPNPMALYSVAAAAAENLGSGGGGSSSTTGGGGGKEDHFKRKASLNDDQGGHGGGNGHAGGHGVAKRSRLGPTAMDMAYAAAAANGIPPNPYTIEEIQMLKAEVKDLQEQLDFMKIQYINQLLPKENSNDPLNPANNIQLLKRLVPQFLHDVWFKNCRSTDDYQRRIIKILTMIVSLFDPEGTSPFNMTTNDGNTNEGGGNNNMNGHGANGNQGQHDANNSTGQNGNSNVVTDGHSNQNQNGGNNGNGIHSTTSNATGNEVVGVPNSVTSPTTTTSDVTTTVSQAQAQILQGMHPNGRHGIIYNMNPTIRTNYMNTSEQDATDFYAAAHNINMSSSSTHFNQ